MFGINGGEFVVLLLLAAVLVGPERLPAYAEQLAAWVRSWRATLTDTKDRLSAELGTEDVDWTALDPRRYDPRRIVRDALLEPDADRSGPVPGGGSGPGAAASAGGAYRASGPGRAGTGQVPEGETGAPVPFDDEAT